MPQQTHFFDYPTAGMASAANPSRIGRDRYSRATNVCLDKELPTTRFGVREIPFDSDIIGDANIQGAAFYNPAKGQSAAQIGKDFSSILLVAGGRKFHLVVSGRKAANATCSVSEVTNVEASNPSLHLSWIFQAENYAIANDGQSDAWIWDGAEPARNSNGLTDTASSSEVPNGGTVGGYSHGRVYTVINSRQIYVGDILHNSNQTNTNDVIRFTETGYWAEGGWFAPPSSMGNILGATILPTRSTESGQGETLFFCEDGTFSIDFNIYPRDSWQTTPMVKHALLKTGASGPYAFTVYDGDVMFRSRSGVQTIRSAAAESRLLGNPLRPVSEAVSDILQVDADEYRRFTVVEQWAEKRRVFITTGLDVNGRYRYGTGALVANFATRPLDSQMWGWESIYVLPRWCGKIAAIVNGIFNGRDRLFFLCHDWDTNEVRLVEMDQSLEHDERADGTCQQISSQFITRMEDFLDNSGGKDFREGKVHLSGVRGKVKVGVWARNTDDGEWIFWGGGTASNGDQSEDCLCGNRDGRCSIGIGRAPQQVSSGEQLQVLIRWVGKATLEQLRVQVSDNSSKNNTFASECRGIGILNHDYDDFEYQSTERWEDAINE